MPRSRAAAAAPFKSVRLLRGRLTPAALGGINRVSGALVAGFGLWALASAVWG